MAGKKNKTVKELSIEVDELKKEILYLREYIDTVKSDVTLKINDVKEDKKAMNRKTKLKCFKCEKTFTTKPLLVNHIAESHRKNIECDQCDSTFTQMYDLEHHIESIHQAKQNFKCNQCNLSFFTNWRLQKHTRMHSKNGKKCHFFNNGKLCPYEKLGCRFEHEVSQKCKFGIKCKKSLCQFMHTEQLRKTEGQQSTNNLKAVKVISPIDFITYDPEEDSDIIKEEQNQTYEEDENFVEYNDSKEIFYNQHRTEDLPNDLINGNEIEFVVGLKLKETTGSFYPCDACDFTSTNMKIHKTHYSEKHGNIVNKYSCVLAKCDYSSDIPKNVIIHMASNHILLIQRRLGKL